MEVAILVAAATRLSPDLPSRDRAERRARARARPVGALACLVGIKSAGADTLAAGMALAPLSLALLSTEVVSQLLLVPLQPQPQPFAVSSAGAVAALAVLTDDAMLMAAAFCGRTRPLGREVLEPSAALPEVLMAWRRARLTLRASDATALWACAGCTLFEAAAVDAATGAFITADAGFTRRADGLLTDAALTVPALPCSAIALRRLRASSRPERVALAVLSVACVITYLVTRGLLWSRPPRPGRCNRDVGIH
ncbi:MAG: hypothetical protein ABFS23_02695 [Pseudomonadota bacterium]